MKAVITASGGMDSATAAYQYAHRGYQLHLVGFDYGQRHVKELSALITLGERLSATVSVIDLKSLGELLGRNSLTSDHTVPDGHYAEETMRQTVVPNRNAIMLNISAGIAQAEGAELVVTGVHSGDHFIYPDCRPQFVDAVRKSISFATEGVVGLDAPFLHLTKADIVREGARLSVPYEITWSCYKGGAQHCGTCGTCFERKEAFRVAGVADPTPYIVEGFEWYKGDKKVEDAPQGGLPKGGELEA